MKDIPNVFIYVLLLQAAVMMLLSYIAFTHAMVLKNVTKDIPKLLEDTYDQGIAIEAIEERERTTAQLIAANDAKHTVWIATTDSNVAELAKRVNG